MQDAISYDDKLWVVTGYAGTLSPDNQIKFMQLAAGNLPIQKQVDILYDYIQRTLESENPGLRSDKSQQTVEDALRATHEDQKGCCRKTDGVRKRN